ncbi:hypothetical protein HanIR_Chr13g0659901 [Helianthus annuus]|nr:hypothetical protein HanIR_Chr13g0659901 [Helianthus annuus]
MLHYRCWITHRSLISDFFCLQKPRSVESPSLLHRRSSENSQNFNSSCRFFSTDFWASSSNCSWCS